MSSFIDITTANFSELKFSDCKQTTGRRFINVYYQKKNLKFKLPKLRIPFNTKLSNYGQLEVNFSLGDNKELIDAFAELDAKIIYFAEEKEMNSQELEYVPTLKRANNDNYPPTVKCKVPNKDNKIGSLFFDKNKTKLDINCNSDVVNLLTQGTYGMSAIECVGMWFNESRYGLSWKIVQVRIEEAPPKKSYQLDECAFEDSDCDLDSEKELLIED